MRRLISIPLSLGALLQPAAAEVPLISPGVAWTAHWLDGRWDHGVGFEVSMTFVDRSDEGTGPQYHPGAYAQLEFYGDSRWRWSVGGFWMLWREHHHAGDGRSAAVVGHRGFSNEQAEHLS